MTASKSWINTRAGVRFEPLDAKPEDVRLDDIAFALSNLCRYGGHVEFYSVAEHSVIVSRIVEALGGSIEEQRAALLHDATEAYLVDLPRPIKHHPAFAFYREAEAALAVVIAKRFGLETLEPAIVKTVDNEMIALEAELLVKNKNPAWTMPAEPSVIARRTFEAFVVANIALGQAPGFARTRFLNRCDELGL